MGESPWYIGKREAILSLIYIYIVWRISRQIILSCKVMANLSLNYKILENLSLNNKILWSLANVLLKYETIYDNNKTYSLNCNILTYMFGKKKHNFHFLQTMLQVSVVVFVRFLLYTLSYPSISFDNIPQQSSCRCWSWPPVLSR